MPSLDIGDALGFNKINFSGNSIALISIIILIALVILGLGGWLVYLIIQKRVYVFKIKVFKKVGNVVTQIAYRKAKIINIGKAGDHLLFVKGVKKHLEFPTLQSATNEYWYYIREDGEWINFGLDDIDELTKKAGIQFVKQDMRLSRISIEDILANRLLHKSFLEKWGMVIGFTIFFLIIAIALTIFMFQYGKIVQQTGAILEQANQILQRTNGANPESTQLIPASIVGLFFRRKKKNENLQLLWT